MVFAFAIEYEINTCLLRFGDDEEFKVLLLVGGCPLEDD